LITPEGLYEAQAAHIYAKQYNGKDDPRNGICLCRMHHWALDVGWIAISDDYFVLVKPTLPQEESYDFIRSFSGRQITLPLDKRCNPHSKYLTAFRKSMGFE
jgi:Predicted restriction endonuclease